MTKPVPYCDGKIMLDISKEIFVEIANEVPGVQDYNELIKFYQRKEWAKFKTAITQYKKVYETTPLLEAVQFLEVQATFEQIDRTDYNDSSQAEKLFKHVVLLYPKSELVPLVYASIATLWLNDGIAQKALGYFEKLKKDFPLHSYSCYFQLGSGEASFMIHDYANAKREFTQLKQKCTERKYVVGANVRLNDLELRKQGDTFLSEYEKPFYSDVNLVNRFYPFVLFNLGEIKFQKKEYKSSKLFFTEFAKYGGKDPVCGPVSLKRLADIALFQDEDVTTVMGKYLSVREQAPLTDIGRYSYILGMLLQFNEVGEIEQARRLKLIDEEVEKINDYELRSLAFLEKGLALLSTGNEASLEYLLNLSDKTNFNLKSGDLGNYIRDKIVLFLESEAGDKESKSKRFDTLSDESILNPYEKIYETWLKGTQYDQRSKQFYKKILMSRFDKSLKKKDGLSAIAKLARWKKSVLWDPKAFTPALRKHIGDSFAVYLKTLNEDELLDLSMNLKRYRTDMEEFLNPNYHMLLVSLDLPNTSKEEIQSHYARIKKDRVLASFSSLVDKKAVSYMHRVKGKMFFLIEKYADAEENLLKAANDKEQKVVVEKELIQLYEKNKQYKKLLKVSLNVFDEQPNMENEHYLETAKVSVALGKLWTETPTVMKRAIKLGLKDKELMPYKLLQARGVFELGKCKEAVHEYEDLMKEELPAEEAAGSKFRFAKCLSKVKQTPKAIKILEEVIAMNDSFWSPLASTEKNLMEIK